MATEEKEKSARDLEDGKSIVQGLLHGVLDH
jgi:hypothetical protein